MSIGEAILLGIIQGISEFFPISSSGHLVLSEHILGLHVPDLIYFNILVHVATLTAVVFYFRKTLLELVKGLHKKDGTSLKLFWALIIGTLPAVAVAILFKDFIEIIFSSPIPVLIAMFITAIFFLIAERYKNHEKTDNHITVKKGLLIGIAQSVALIPGVSRSGSTLATGLLTKLNRSKAAEFSFLLAIPAIAGAAVFGAFDLSQSEMQVDWAVYSGGFIAALISGYISIAFLMELYKKYSLKAFAWYLIAVFIIGTVLTVVT